MQAGGKGSRRVLFEARAHSPMRLGSSSSPEFRAADEAEPAGGSPIAEDAAAAELYPATRRQWRGNGRQGTGAPSAPAGGFDPDGPLSPDGFRSEYDERASERRKMGLRHAARLQAEEEEGRRRAAELAALREARSASAGRAHDDGAEVSEVSPERESSMQPDLGPGHLRQREARAAVGEEEPDAEEAALLDELLAATRGTSSM